MDHAPKVKYNIKEPLTCESTINPYLKTILHKTSDNSVNDKQTNFNYNRNIRRKSRETST